MSSTESTHSEHSQSSSNTSESHSSHSSYSSRSSQSSQSSYSSKSKTHSESDSKSQTKSKSKSESQSQSSESENEVKNDTKYESQSSKSESKNESHSQSDSKSQTQSKSKTQSETSESKSSKTSSSSSKTSETNSKSKTNSETQNETTQKQKQNEKETKQSESSEESSEETKEEVTEPNTDNEDTNQTPSNNNENLKEYPLIYFNNKQKNILQKLPNNAVKTTKYYWWSFLPVYLFNQFKYFINLFFLIVAILSCIPQIQAASPVASIVPLCIMLAFSTVREFIDEIRKYIADRKLNRIEYTKLNTDGSKINIQSREIYSGEILVLENNARVPADGIPLRSTNNDGVVYIETAELDGETNLKQRLVPSHFIDKDESYISGLDDNNSFLTTYPTPNFDQFIGTFTINNMKYSINEKNFIPNGCTIRNTEETLFFVVYCGKDTKLSKNSSKPKIKFSHTNQLFNRFVGIALSFDFLVILFSTLMYYLFTNKDAELTKSNGLGKWYIPKVDNVWEQTFLHLFSFLNLYSFLVPVSCLVSLEFSKTFQMWFMTGDKDMNIHTKNAIGEVERKKFMPWTSALNDELGLVEYVLSDKTGTLTENEMNFMKCSIEGHIIKENGKGTIIKELNNTDDNNNKHSMKQSKKKKRSSSSSSSSSSSEDDDEMGKHNRYSKNNKDENANLIEKEEEHHHVSKTTKSSHKKTKKELEKSKRETKEKDEHYYQRVKEFLMCLSICHEAVPNIQGDTIKFQSSSPDEVALLEEAKRNGYIFKKRTQKSIEVEIDDEQRQIDIQAIFPFDSDRKRMSVLVRLWDGKLFLYTKGSDMTTLPLMKEGENIQQAQNDVNKFAAEGYRTLVFGYKQISDEYFIDWMQRYDQAKSLVKGRDEQVEKVVNEMEKELILLGVSAVEDKLQDGVPQTIDSLRRAGIKIWMITGDKMETAINIGHTCRMTQGEKVIVMTPELCEEIIQEPIPHEIYSVCFDHQVYTMVGDKEEFWKLILKAKAVICCRVTPKIKGEIMKNVRERTGKVCLGIGDGGNDIPLIKESDVGVGIFGKEGTQAAQTSDYAVRKFRHLQKLIFFHGRLALRRNTMIVKMSFYKNVAFIMMQFWFGLQNQFSGTSLYEDMIITLFNMVMTSMPPIFVGAFEIDVPFFGVRDYPELHKEIIEKKSFLSIKSYISYIILALYQSIVIFVLANVTFMKSDILNIEGLTGGYGYVSILMTITGVITILTTLGLGVKAWNIFMILGWAFSLFLGFLCIILVSFMKTMSKGGLSTNSFIWITASPISYLFIILAVLIAVAPKLVINVCDRMIRPKKYQIIQELVSIEPYEQYGKARPVLLEGSEEATSYVVRFCSAKPLVDQVNSDEYEMYDSYN